MADSGERRKPHRTGHFGVRGGQGKECVLKLSWPSTAEYRMMKLKKKSQHTMLRMNWKFKNNFFSVEKPPAIYFQ